jgi:indolepyruvate ferredoxin oxidoreductase beta subunit
MRRLTWQAVVAGVGGQGVLFVTRVLAGAAARTSGRVLVSEVHGMAQRGGAVVSHLKAGPFAAPLVSPGRAECVLALEPGEAVRNLAFLAPGAALVVDAPGPEFLSPRARRVLARRGVRTLFHDATTLAREAGAPRGANLALVAAAAREGMLPFSPAELWRAVEAVTPPARLEANRRLWQAALA